MLLTFILFFGSILLIYLGYKKWKRHQFQVLMDEAFATPFPKEYANNLSNFTPYRFLNPEEKKRFEAKILFFLKDKNFNGVGDLVISQEMKLLVAAEACLMITNLSGGIYPGLKNIYLIEDIFIPKDNPVNMRTGLPTHVARLGEAWKRGPIVLSWNSIKQGSSVVFHEFSHQLDQQDGSFDGTPKLGKTGNYDKWAEVMGKEFLNLRARVQVNKSSDIDSYGATNEAEFFAVVTEYFFTRPNLLKDKHPGIYELYCDYFKLNPSSWVVI